IPGTGSVSVDATGEPHYLANSAYYDVLVNNAFGDYRQLLGAVALHPVMGKFLSHLANAKGDPEAERFADENFAREVMQLFSIGVHELDSNGVVQTDNHGKPVPTYDNVDITELARVFTGLSYAGAPGFGTGVPTYRFPMQMFENFHDQGEKVLLGGLRLPAGQPGMADINAALDNLAAHDNVAPFISRLLIQRFVNANPSRAYLGRVAAVFNDNGSGQKGDLRAVLKAILLDEEALGGYRFMIGHSGAQNFVSVARGGSVRSRLREPVVRYAAFLRAFDPQTDHPSGQLRLPQMMNFLSQAPFSAPGVFNFYLPDHVPAGPISDYDGEVDTPNGVLVAPEFQIMHSTSVNRLVNRFYADLAQRGPVFPYVLNGQGSVSHKISLDFDREIALAGDPDELVRHLDILLCGGALNDGTATIISTVVGETTSDPWSRARGAIEAVLTAPECAVSG
ncbi:MAG: DUF1800 family protein, partial [Gammaproteobacteria bacterium]